ncbi:MAG: recombinase family protein [Chloroflexi bacterium]|nr:recombinase family protein [Chloroflexota bacterium]
MSRARRSNQVDLDEIKAPPKTALLWLRVSTKEQSVIAQKSRLKSVAKKMKLKVVKTIELEGYSAWKGEHAERLEEALAAAEAKEFSHFLMFSLDRLDRRGVAETLNSLNRMWKAGVEVVSVQEPWLSDPNMREVFAAFVAWVANFQSKNRSEHVLNALDLLRKQKKVRGRLPWAYTWIGEEGKGYHELDDEGRLRPNPDRVPTVELIFDLYVNQHLGVDRVVEELSSRSISPSVKEGKRWSRKGVQSALGEESYKSGVHEKYDMRTIPIISAELWDRADVLRVKNNRFKPAASNRIWPFQGATCAACGSPLGVDSGGGRRRDYFCRGRYKSGGYYKRTGEVCRATDRLKADVVEPAALEVLHTSFADPSAMIRALDTRIQEIEEREVDLSRDLAPIEARLAKIKQSLSRLAMDWVDDDIDEVELERRRGELKSEQESLQRRREAIGPDQKKEIERTRTELTAALEFRSIAESRERQGVSMKQFSTHPEHAQSPELSAMRKSGIFKLDMPDDESVPEVLADWLHRLHAEVSLHADPARLEIRGIISADVFIGDQDSRQTAPLGRGLR